MDPLERPRCALFELVKHYAWTREGEHPLTREIEAEPASASYAIVARRPSE